MWFAIIMFWHYLTLVHRLVLYWIVFQPRILFLYLWIRHGEINTASGVVITYIIRQAVSLPEECRYETVFQFRTSARQSYGGSIRDSFRLLWFLIVFSEPPTSGSFYWFGGLQTPLASPSEACVLVTRGPNQVLASLHPGA